MGKNIDIKKTLERISNKYYQKDITGATVKIDVDKILSRSAISTNFRKFIEESKDKKFTAKLDVDNGYTKMYTLEEDETPVKWLFHIEDLILVE